VAGVIIAVVVAVAFLFLWFRAGGQPSAANLPNQAPPGFGGVPGPPR
jgi:hypothetical protein